MTTKKTPEKILNGIDEQLRNYELVLIINPEIVDEALNNTIDTVSQFIINKGGVVSSVEQWGKRRLAYPIRHFTEGNYVLAQFALKPEISKEVEARLRISEDILRHLLVGIE